MLIKRFRRYQPGNTIRVNIGDDTFVEFTVRRGEGTATIAVTAPREKQIAFEASQDSPHA